MLYGYQNNRNDASYWSRGKCIKSRSTNAVMTGSRGNLHEVGGPEQRLAGGAVYCLLDASVRVTSVRQRRLNYLPCVPANEHLVPRVRKGTGRYFITEQSGTGICLYGLPTYRYADKANCFQILLVVCPSGTWNNNRQTPYKKKQPKNGGLRAELPPWGKLFRTILLRFNRGHRLTFFSTISCRYVPLQKMRVHCTRYT